MPKVTRFHHRDTTVGRFLQQSTAFPAQVRKVSFEDTSSSGANSSTTGSLYTTTLSSSVSSRCSSSSSSCCSINLPSNESNSSPPPSRDQTANRECEQKASPSSSSSETSNMGNSPLHRSAACKSLHEQQHQLLLQQDRSKQLILRRPATSVCLSELASLSSSPCVQDMETLSPYSNASFSRGSSSSPSSSPWGHFVDVIPLDGDSLPSPPSSETDDDDLEDGYFHPDALLFWSQHNNNSNNNCNSSSSDRNGRKSNRFEPYTKSNPRLLRCKKSLSPTDIFAHDFMLPPSYMSSQHEHQQQHGSSNTGVLTMSLTREVQETMERLHF